MACVTFRITTDNGSAILQNTTLHGSIYLYKLWVACWPYLVIHVPHWHGLLVGKMEECSKNSRREGSNWGQCAIYEGTSQQHSIGISRIQATWVHKTVLFGTFPKYGNRITLVLWRLKRRKAKKFKCTIKLQNTEDKTVFRYTHLTLLVPLFFSCVSAIMNLNKDPLASTFVCQLPFTLWNIQNNNTNTLHTL